MKRAKRQNGGHQCELIIEHQLPFRKLNSLIFLAMIMQPNGTQVITIGNKIEFPIMYLDYRLEYIISIKRELCWE